MAGDRRVRSAQGRARLQIGSRERGGAHPEHVAHFCDAGRVEAQWLVEHRRGLPRVKSRACVAGRGAGRGAGGGGRPRCEQRAREGSTAQIGSRARGGAHPEHEAHIYDAGGVEAQRLVERRRLLPRAERRATVRGEVRPGRWRATVGCAACRGGLDGKLWESSARGAERTSNMLHMAVTLDVSKLSGWLNTDAPCRDAKRGHAMRCEVLAGRG